MCSLMCDPSEKRIIRFVVYEFGLQRTPKI